MRGEIRSLQRRLGITSIYVTHDQEEAFSIADLVAIMNRGRLVQLGTPRELYRQPADRFVAEFVGLSNIVPVELVTVGANDATIRVFGQTLRSRRPPLHTANSTALVLRPEALRIGPEGAGGTPARVVTMTYVGPIARYVVAVDGEAVQLLTVDLYNPGPEEFFAEGTVVSLQLPEEVPALLG
jgi:ABC-type Fe3+/spermidine/putrescine transport system ATPase subunit